MELVTIVRSIAVSAIDQMLEDARDDLDRVPAGELDTEAAAGALIVDIRPAADRLTDGELPGAVVIERNVLEWRLDPTSPHAIDAATLERRVILVCNEGYASSLAAHSLRQLGITGATDLDGGYRAWKSLQPPHAPPPA
jgi:rhodanese-related sulfurtransferase